MERLQWKSGQMQSFSIKMSTHASLLEIKKDLPDVVGKQVRNLSMFNFCAEDHFPNETSCITFAQGLGLLPDNQSQIFHCKGKCCRVVTDKTKKIGYKYRCYNKKPHSKEICLATVSPRENTVFEGTHLTIHDVFKVVMCFVSQLTVKQAVEQLGISKETVTDWCVLCREVCEIILANEFQGKIGGEGMIVEVEESHLLQHKYGVGRKRKWEDKWLLNCYCRDTKQRRTVFVEDKKSSTIMPLLLKVIDKRSIIVTDVAQVYKACERYGFHAHKSVCDKRYFVCPFNNNISTSNLEAKLQRWHKGRVPRFGDKGCIDRNLAEGEYRQRYFHNMDLAALPLDDKFLLFLYHIKLVYPGPGKVGMTFPLLEDVNDENSSESIDTNSVEDLLDDLVEDTDIESPLRKKFAPPISGLVMDIEYDKTDTSEYAKCMCKSFILGGLHFGCPLETIKLFSRNEQTLLDMLGHLRSTIPQTCDESTVRIDQTLQNELHPTLRSIFAVISTPAAGDCFYQAVALTLFGDLKFMELIRLSVAFMLVRYHDVFQTAIADMGLETDFNMNDPMHFITVGAATPSGFAKRCMQMNKGKEWARYSDTFCWANNITVLACSLACQRPLYIYNTFRQSDGSWRHPADVSLAEFDRRSDIGGSLTVAHRSFSNAEPCRLLLHQNHYSAILPVVNTFTVRLKPSIFNPIPNFSLHDGDQIQ